MSESTKELLRIIAAGQPACVQDTAGRHVATFARRSDAEQYIAYKTALEGLNPEAVRELVEAAEGVVVFFRGFDAVADAFYRDTHMTRPGRDAPSAMYQPPYEDRAVAFEAWHEARWMRLQDALAKLKEV